MAIASLTALVTLVVMADGGYVSCRWCGESGTLIMSSAAAKALLLLLLCTCYICKRSRLLKQLLMGVAWLYWHSTSHTSHIH